MVALVLVGQNAVDAELLTALLAIGLNRLHICYMSIAKLSDQAELIHKWFVSVHVQKTVLVRLVQIQKLTRTTGHWLVYFIIIIILVDYIYLLNYRSPLRFYHWYLLLSECLLLSDLQRVIIVKFWLIIMLYFVKISRRSLTILQNCWILKVLVINLLNRKIIALISIIFTQL